METPDQLVLRIAQGAGETAVDVVAAEGVADYWDQGC